MLEMGAVVMTTVLYYPIENNLIREEDLLEEKLRKCRYNTGNVIWAEAVKNNIFHERDWTSADINMTDEVNYVLPMANHINVNDTCIEMYGKRLLKNSNARISMLGLGAQLTKEYNTPQKLVAAIPEGQKSALKALSERTGLIGIRGQITAECLDLLGIHNYIVIGCPSFYGHGAEFPAVPASSMKSVCFNWSGENKDSSLNRKIMLNGGDAWSCLIMQSMSDLPKTIYEDAKILERHVERLFPGGGISPEQLTGFVKCVGNMFFGAKEWDKYLREKKFTMSVGCRFHGNMRALLSGIPALWITHDSRTYELAEALHLPAIPLEKANKISQLEELVEYCKYEMDFYDHYKIMYQEYLRCLASNGLVQK